SDHPPPSVQGAPDAAELVSAAVDDSGPTSRITTLDKSCATAESMTKTVVTNVERNEAGKFRISEIDVQLVPQVAGDAPTSRGRYESLLEDFCIVTESVRRGVPVSVSVKAREAQMAG